MLTAHEMRDKYAELVEEMDVMVEIAKEEKRELSEKEQARIEEIESKLGELEHQIEVKDRLEKRLAKKAESDKKEDIRHKREKQTEDQNVVKRYNLLRALNMQMRGKHLDGVEGEMHQEAEREAQRSNISLDGFGIPQMFFKPRNQQRDLTAGTANQGGNTVQTTVSDLIPYLWPRTTIEALGATVLTGLTSNIQFPTQSAVPTGTWEGETDAGAESSPTFGTVTLSPNRVGTYVDVSKQLIVQSSVPGLDRVVTRDIERAIANALETAAINGSGSGNQPTGILNNGSVGIEAIGANGGSPDWGNIVALEANVANDNADMGSMAYLTTPGIRGALKTIEKASNTAQFIWETSAMTGISSLTVGEGMLNGYRAAVSTLVPSELEKGTGYNLHAIIFGNFQEMLLGNFGPGVDIVVDPYTQATSTLLRIVVNSWWDVALRHAESFAVIKDASAGEFNT